MGKVGTHSRKSYEMRFQNPANPAHRPIVQKPGVVSILMGIHLRPSGDLVVVIGDIGKRVGDNNRWSVLFHSDILTVADSYGWAEYSSKSDERIIACRGTLFPAFVEAVEVLPMISDRQVRSAVTDAGFLSAADGGAEPDGNAVERARRAVTRLVRDAKFKGRVSAAYDDRCAVTGVNWGLAEAAHLLPVAAPGSTDEVRNGIALAPSVHTLFDRHMLFIDPRSFQIVMHPDLLKAEDETAVQFLSQIGGSIRLPTEPTDRPNPDMLVKRYQFFGAAYDWTDTTRWR